MTDNNKNPTDRVNIRPAVLPDDEDFLRELYFSTRDDLLLLPLDPTQKHAFIAMQYTAQKQQYAAQYPDAKHDLILRDGIPAGRMLVDRRPGGIYLVDISLLAECRGMGVGTVIMKRLVAEAEDTASVLSLHVMKTNPAARLYLRMGFKVTAEDGFYLEMKKPLA